MKAYILKSNKIVLSFYLNMSQNVKNIYGFFFEVVGKQDVPVSLKTNVIITKTNK